MWFLLGMLIGALAGCLVCVRYLRREIAADIGPRLQRIQLQLDNLETALNLALVTRYADLTGRLPQEPSLVPSSAIPPRPRLPEPPFGTYG
jgi:hypothetical protein